MLYILFLLQFFLASAVHMVPCTGYSKLAEHNGDFILSLMKQMDGQNFGHLEISCFWYEDCHCIPPQMDQIWKGYPAYYVFFVAPKVFWDGSGFDSFHFSTEWRSLGQPDTTNTNGDGKHSFMMRPVYIGETADIEERYNNGHKNKLAKDFFNNALTNLHPKDYNLYLVWFYHRPEEDVATQHKFKVKAVEEFFLLNYDFPLNMKLNNVYRDVSNNLECRNTLPTDEKEDGKKLLRMMMDDVCSVCYAMFLAYAEQYGFCYPCLLPPRGEITP